MATVGRLRTSAQVAGERIKFVGTLKQHGTRLKQNGLQERWLLLVNVSSADAGNLMAKRIWFRDGKWSRNMKPGHRYSFCARVERCQGNREAPNISGRINERYRLANPNKVLEVAIPKEERDVESKETRTFKVSAKGRKVRSGKKGSVEQKQPLVTRKERSRVENSRQTPSRDVQKNQPPSSPSERRNNTARKRRSTTISSIFENRRDAGSRRVRQWTG